VTIPGALFLSLVFDERCATASADDFLQLYEDTDCKEPFGEKYAFFIFVYIFSCLFSTYN
jgi:hypothetical protein